MLALYEISTLEMWPDYMFIAIDARFEKVPLKDNNKLISLFFVIFIFVTSFFIMNLFVGVMIDKFNEIRREMDGSIFLTSKQTE